MRATLIVEGGIAHPLQCEVDEHTAAQLGRNRENTIVLQDRRASRSHARVYFRDGHFWISYQPTTNDTLLDGTPLRADAPLFDGQVIGIGDVRIRFHCPECPAEEPSDEPHLVSAPTLDPTDATVFRPDDLTALFRFMNDSLGEATPARLVNFALDAALRQTGADLAGFLSLDDVENPDLRLVLPPRASVDRRLSSALTQRVLRERRTVWLNAAGSSKVDSDSLSDVHDAVCVPLRASPGETPLGALHVYKGDRAFSDRHVRFCEVLGGALASALHLLRARRALEADNQRLRVHASAAGDDLIGSSAAMMQLRQCIKQLAAGPCTVLIHGESGTGKELVALDLHRNSPRRGGPLVAVNCAAINESMAESELFGHVKGAFTTALRDHAGYFAQADMGTLFLDEIGELSLDLQAKLLRAIEYRCFRPVGALRESKADVRIIAATNRDLEREVREGNFRRDLFFRLTSRLSVPPLREHLDDLPELVEHFLELFAVEYRRRVTLSESALERLNTFSWPGNVRQLRSVLESAVAMAQPGGMIHAGDLHLVNDPLAEPPQDCPASVNLQQLEQWAIRRALAQAKGARGQTARLLGIHRDTLNEKLRKYGIGDDA
jgi:transcriptional regulator with GAF, ATPase, and Fis domain